MRDNKKFLVVIAGPTAIGKSSLALELADRLSTEIISADSRQIYRGLDIGTAKPTHDELVRFKHHFVDSHDVHERFTAADFEDEAIAIMAKLHRERSTVIACGGTGLYLRALMEGLDQIPTVPPEVRIEFDELYRVSGIQTLQQELAKRDPAYYASVDVHNHRRLIRALSVIKYTGQPFSGFHRKTPKERPFEILPILLHLDRSLLYARINQRVDQMIQAGLEAEAQKYQAQANLPALQTVGYQEWFPYFEGVYDKEETIRLIKRNTRRYAKRQMTWFKKYGSWRFFPSTDWQGITGYINQSLLQ